MAESNGRRVTTGIDFCTLGMFIIDDIYPSPTTTTTTTNPTAKPHLNIIGGAGTYSALGARLLSPPPFQSKSIAWIVDTGTDFPEELKSQLLSWRTRLLLRPRGENELTTRGWNGYCENEHRDFYYLTEKKRLTPDDLTLEFLSARSFHLICSPGRCVEMCVRLRERRREEGISSEEDDGEEGKGGYVVIWEPVPDLCVPEELENVYEALQYVDVVSPNHEELAALFGEEGGHSSSSSSTGEIDTSALEKQALALLSHSTTRKSPLTVLIRAGPKGIFIATSTLHHWLPAYHQNPQHVIDPTGGGNAFLGGFAVGFVRNDGDVVEAARWGSVAASFCIEQVGVPRLETLVETKGCVDEVWNGESVWERVEEFRGRTRGACDGGMSE